MLKRFGRRGGIEPRRLPRLVEDQRPAQRSRRLSHDGSADRCALHRIGFPERRE